MIPYRLKLRNLQSSQLCIKNPSSVLHNYNPILLNCTVFVQSMIQLRINHRPDRYYAGNCHRMKKNKPRHMVSFEIFYTRYILTVESHSVLTIVTCISSSCDTIYCSHTRQVSINFVFCTCHSRLIFLICYILNHVVYFLFPEYRYMVHNLYCLNLIN